MMHLEVRLSQGKRYKGKPNCADDRFLSTLLLIQQMIQVVFLKMSKKKPQAIKGIPFRLCSSVGICLLWISHQRLPLSLLIYTLAAPSALLPIHQLQWEDSPLRVNFMPIYGQRMWRSPLHPPPQISPSSHHTGEMESDVATSGRRCVAFLSTSPISLFK